ncbi:MAG: anaerobic ribonucleoside-triphosphate reductase activating protein [Ruminococcus sp.]|nr:anaerobic ribonucleoside-triphosphate reductase activating protein [Ruminococcus sp.]
MKFRCAGLTPESIVDGPGLRFTVWTQGCLHNCEGCHNPQTHALDGGFEADTDEVFEQVISNPLLDGVTLSGGDPFFQAKAMAQLARRIRCYEGFKLNVIAYTGFTYEELLELADDNNGYLDLLRECDYLIDGRFVLAERSLELKFRGSRNQRFIDVQRSLAEGRVVVIDDETLSLM